MSVYLKERTCRLDKLLIDRKHGPKKASNILETKKNILEKVLQKPDTLRLLIMETLALFQIWWSQSISIQEHIICWQVMCQQVMLAHSTSSNYDVDYLSDPHHLNDVCAVWMKESNRPAWSRGPRRRPDAGLRPAVALSAASFQRGPV